MFRASSLTLLLYSFYAIKLFCKCCCYFCCYCLVEGILFDHLAYKALVDLFYSSALSVSFRLYCMVLVFSLLCCWKSFLLYKDGIKKREREENGDEAKSKYSKQIKTF